MRRRGVRKEVERIEREEGELINILLKTRQDLSHRLLRLIFPISRDF